jgi:hypothetical protein
MYITLTPFIAFELVTVLVLIATVCVFDVGRIFKIYLATPPLGNTGGYRFEELGEVKERSCLVAMGVTYVSFKCAELFFRGTSNSLIAYSLWWICTISTALVYIVIAAGLKEIFQIYTMTMYILTLTTLSSIHEFVVRRGLITDYTRCFFFTTDLFIVAGLGASALSFVDGHTPWVLFGVTACYALAARLIKYRLYYVVIPRICEEGGAVVVAYREAIRLSPETLLTYEFILRAVVWCYIVVVFVAHLMRT